MKKKQIDQTNELEGFKAFVDEYVTPKNVALGVGIASLAGLATYSTVRALRNEKLVNKIRRELNFEYLKDNIKDISNSTFKGFKGLGFGFFNKKKNQGAGEKSSERTPAKRTQRSSNKGGAAKTQNRRRYVTG